MTGGTGTGVMEFVGEGIRDHIITFGKRDNIVALGIPTWGAVAMNEALDGDDVREYFLSFWFIPGCFFALFTRITLKTSCPCFRPKNSTFCTTVG